MTSEISLLTNSPYWELPRGVVGWIGWIVYLGVLVYLIWRWRIYNKRKVRFQWGILVGLLLLLPLTNLLFVLRLPALGVLSPPDKPISPLGPAAVIFSGLPWMLAAGLLGVTPAAVFGLLAGLISSLFDTHSPFTFVTFALWGTLLGAAFQQRYRTIGFRLLQRPMIAASLLILAFPIFFVIENLLIVDGNLASCLDYTFSWIGPAWKAAAIELLVAGLIVEVISQTLLRYWGSSSALQPSPVEKRLQSRFIVSLLPLALGLLIVMFASIWLIAGNAAQRVLKERLASATEMTAQSIPYFLETGQILIQQAASNSLWYDGTPEQVSAQLAQSLRILPYFSEIYLLNVNGEPLDGVPGQNFLLASPTPEEYFGISLALNGVPFQTYTIPPANDETAARVSFFASIYDPEMQLRGILIGRTGLASNPLMQPALVGLHSLTGIVGEGMLVNEDGQIIYRSNQGGIMESFTGRVEDKGLFYEGTAIDGTRSYFYTMPINGSSWFVAAAVPSSQAQQLALQIAAPLLAIVILVFLVGGLLLRFTIQGIIASLNKLALEAHRLSTGQLDIPVHVDGEDELGQLRRSFELMRSNLKARLDEHSKLVVVSQGIAASLEFEEAVRPILEAALSTGACSTRVVLSPEAVPEVKGINAPAARFGAGSAGEMYTSLDDQVLNLARQQERIVITNLPRVRLLNITPGSPRPESILALPLRHESQFFGTLWLAYDAPHQFPEDEIRFISTLAGQAALAASNTRLFAHAEVGRQRLKSILDSAPDPILVTDHDDNLLLSNPAAWELLGLGVETGQGQPIDRVIHHDELLRVLHARGEERMSTEVTLPDGKVYLAMASNVSVDGHAIGRICILRDVTHFKESDAMKSDFVSTVSHDLRSPLTLMRGYATMLEMVGDLNDQQTSYVRKIVTSVENMSRLVNTLLDLGRIEAGVDLQLEMVSTHDIVDRVVASIQLQASQRQIAITTEIDPQAAPFLEADQALLQQALHNLIDNAVKYTEPGGKVFIRVLPDQERIIFEVSDTGIGIAPVDVPHLFEKFYRGGQREAKKRQGIGLGLAIVKSIAGRHNGEVWAESQLGKGSIFYFAIPVRQQERERHA